LPIRFLPPVEQIAERHEDAGDTQDPGTPYAPSLPIPFLPPVEQTAEQHENLGDTEAPDTTYAPSLPIRFLPPVEQIAQQRQELGDTEASGTYAHSLPVQLSPPVAIVEQQGEKPWDTGSLPLPPRPLDAVAQIDESSGAETGSLLTGAAPALAHGQRWAAASDGLAGVEQQARGAIRQGYDLAQKGALYSARAEFLEALRAVAAALDSHYGDAQHTDALLAATRALKEADDFAEASTRLESTVSVAAIRATHRTKVLSGEAGRVSPLLAMQQYYAFARSEFTTASGGAPIAAEALYGLGKVYMAFGEPSGAAERMHGPKAMTFLAAALTVDPLHAPAANELGVLYARAGKWHEARQALEQSLAARPAAESWHNLAVVYDRLGDAPLAAQARRQAQLAAAPNRELAATVQWVDPVTFAAGNAHPAHAAAGGSRAETPPERTATRWLPELRWPW
jgi:tetratricopeptide (TPR) repeat protein